ncbi:hypothetical protein FPHYL_3681 [Fusarium phyllophilum]|uniref:Uncharacterized protein n=1 Tax=Fusarium phyllophilum TaxID=47803 RepID=A0A8H5NII8_9HYPO|nr:hypothetical protein FPHYL_3681 [Fusarium phyllophilum]
MARAQPNATHAFTNCTPQLMAHTTRLTHGIVNEEDLADALEKGEIWGPALTAIARSCQHWQSMSGHGSVRVRSNKEILVEAEADGTEPRPFITLSV